MEIQHAVGRYERSFMFRNPSDAISRPSGTGHRPGLSRHVFRNHFDISQSGGNAGAATGMSAHLSPRLTAREAGASKPGVQELAGHNSPVRQGEDTSEVAVYANPHANVNTLNRLSVLDHGKSALVTVENLKAAAIVRLSDGRRTEAFRGCNQPQGEPGAELLNIPLKQCILTS